MRVLRAILGRFARLLVRIARTLDPGVAATPYPAAAGRMAVLRQRYPGAPEHWLELLARRTSLGVGDGGPAQHPAPDGTRDGQAFAANAPATPGEAARVGMARTAERATPRFPLPVNRRRAVVQSVGAERPSRRTRPVPSFGVPGIRNRIVTLLGGNAVGQPREGPRFADGRPSPHREPHGPRADPNAAREEHSAQFPSAERPPERDWIGARQTQPADHAREAAAGWPEFRFSTPPGSSWPAETSRHERPNPRFAALDGRWPELPAFLDEPGSTGLSASDEAALLAEQIGGKWSA